MHPDVRLERAMEWFGRNGHHLITDLSPSPPRVWHARWLSRSWAAAEGRGPTLVEALMDLAVKSGNWQPFLHDLDLDDDFNPHPA